MKLYFGRDEDDVITIEPGATTERTVTSAVAMRPMHLHCEVQNSRGGSVGWWPVMPGTVLADCIIVDSLCIGDHEQLTGRTTLSVLLGAPVLALKDISAGVPVYIKLTASVMTYRVAFILWLEDREIELREPHGDTAIIGDGVTCGTRSKAEQVAHLEHELQKAHAQRDVAIDALERIAAAIDEAGDRGRAINARASAGARLVEAQDALQRIPQKAAPELRRLTEEYVREAEAAFAAAQENERSCTAAKPARSQEIAKEALKQIHALRRPDDATKKGH